MKLNKRQHHPADVEKWVERVINSCTTTDQVISAEQLIQNFERQYGQIDFATYHHFTRRLWSVAYDKYESIFQKKYLLDTKE